MDAGIARERTGHAAPSVPSALLVAVGLAAMALPTCLVLARQDWTRDQGAHQPLVLATGAWLLWREWPSLREGGAPGRLSLTLVLLGLGILSYVAGTVVDFVTFAAGGIYLTGIAILQSRFGAAALRRTWFPLLYLAFAVPPPSAWVDRATLPLKSFVSYASTGLLHAAGLPVAREGVTIFAGPYQLLVEDACSGMNSLFGLTALSLFYVHLRRGLSVRYAFIVLALAIPIAVAANTVRIMGLILLTYFFGDAVGQSFLHKAAGLVLFGVALGLIFAVDEVLGPKIQKAKTA